MPFTDTGWNTMLDELFASTVYVGLSSSNPASSVTEDADISRVSVAAAGWTAASSGSLSNVSDITITKSGGSSFAAGWVVIYDAATSGNLLAWAPLDAGETINDGNSLIFGAGKLVFDGTPTGA